MTGPMGEDGPAKDIAPSFTFPRGVAMPTTIELPIRVEDTDTAVSLNDLLSTLKVSYTVTNCLRCGLIATAPELTETAQPELALA